MHSQIHVANCAHFLRSVLDMFYSSCSSEKEILGLLLQLKHCNVSCAKVLQHDWTTLYNAAYLAYTVHQMLHFCCRLRWVWLARLQWDVSNTDALKTIILVLSSEVSLFQGEINYVRTHSSVLINQVSLFQACMSFMRGSTECLLKLERPQHLQGSINKILFGNQDCSMPNSPSRDYTCLPAVTWDHYTPSDKIYRAFLLHYANKVIKFWRQ